MYILCCNLFLAMVRSLFNCGSSELSISASVNAVTLLAIRVALATSSNDF